MIDVVAPNGVPTGEVLPRKEVHSLGKLHRAVHLYLFNKKNDLLLQRRSAFVDHYPNRLSISVTGHIDAGESSVEAVRRELSEELGISATEQNFHFLFSYRKDAVLSPTYIDRQINDVYACWTDFDLNNMVFDRTEVCEVIWVSLPDFKKMVELGTSDIAPVYGDAIKRIIPLIKGIIYGHLI